MRGSDIIAAARARLDAPYRHQGRGPQYDCLGLVIAAVREAGFDMIDRRDYAQDPGDELIPYLDAQLSRVSNPEPGDILALRFSRIPTHLAIWTGESLIHCHSRVGKVTEHGMDRKWQRRIHSVWRAV